MSKWTKETRDDLPLKYFGDPDGRKYPIQDQDDVDAAARLVGRAPEDQQDDIRKRIIAICKELKLDPPKAWADQKFSAGDDMSFSELMNALAGLLGTDPDHDGDEDYPYVVDVMPSSQTFVYSNDQQLYSQGYSVDASGAVQLVGKPVEVTAVTNYQPETATLSLFSADSDSVVYEGEIFRTGNYPDKGLNATDELLDELAQNTSFAQIKLEHVDTVLDGALEGFGLVSVRKAGNLLFGTVKLPSWMRGSIGKAIKVSVGLDLVRKTIKELSLVLDPRVPTAQISAAFASTRHSMADKADIQKIHDHAVSLGAKCEPEMSGARHSKADLDDIQAMHDLAVKQGASCNSEPAETENTDEPKMKKTVGERLRRFFTGNPEGLKEAEIEIGELEDAAPEPAVIDFASELAKLKSDNDRQRKLALRNQAKQFADEQIRLGKAIPAQKEKLEAMFVSAATVDGNGVVNFSDNGDVASGEALKSLKAFFAEAKSHKLFSTEIAGDELSANAERGELSDEAKRQVYNATGLGQQAAKAEAAKSGGKN